MTIVPKNRHIDAATAIVGSQLRAKALLNGLACKPSDTYMFLANGRKTYTESLLLLQNVGRSTTFLATSPQCTEQVQPVSQLIKQGVEVALKSPARLAQAIMGPQEPLLEEAFENAGFAPLSMLYSMESLLDGLIPNEPSGASELDVLPYCDLSEQELQQVLVSTYKGSLDCPGIHGIRPVEDIIAGHKDSPHYDDSFWFIAKLHKKLAGVLLLTPVPEVRCIDITYLGASPHARGKGVGNSLVRKAYEVAQDSQYKRISLAVDAQNTPAIHLYQRWNFRKIGQRFTMIKKLF